MENSYANPGAVEAWKKFQSSGRFIQPESLGKNSNGNYLKNTFHQLLNFKTLWKSRFQLDYFSVMKLLELWRKKKKWRKADFWEAFLFKNQKKSILPIRSLDSIGV